MRTFQHKTTITDAGAIMIFAFGALACLWHRTNSLMVVLGVILIIVTLRAVDKAIHTSYRLSDDDHLKIKTGHIGRALTIKLESIKTVDKRPLAFRLGDYVILELKDGRVVSLQPDNVESFLGIIKKRLDRKQDIQ